MKRVILYIVLVVTLSSCFKDEEYSTKMVVRPYVQAVSGGDFVGYEDCVAYAFDADTAEWEVLSWIDARNGVLTSKEDPSKTLAPIAVAQSYTEEGLEDTMLSMQVNEQSVMVVVAHTTTEDYGYRLYDVGLNLSTTYVTARFRTWKEGEYTESYWIYYSLGTIEESTEEESIENESTEDESTEDESTENESTEGELTEGEEESTEEEDTEE
ncbi:MAG: hypothetical protein SNI70_05675 [Rikenellaceae bacterium]